MVSTHSFFSKLGGLYETQPFKQKSAEYARAKDLGIKRASDMVDVENIKHIAQNQTLIGDVVGKTADDWKAQKELFYQKTGILHLPVKDSVDVVGKEHDKSQQKVAEEHDKSQQEVAEEQDDNEDFSKELEEVFCLRRTTLTLNNKGELV